MCQEVGEGPCTVQGLRTRSGIGYPDYKKTYEASDPCLEEDTQLGNRNMRNIWDDFKG